MKNKTFVKQYLHVETKNSHEKQQGFYSHSQRLQFFAGQFTNFRRFFNYFKYEKNVKNFWKTFNNKKFQFASFLLKKFENAQTTCHNENFAKYYENKNFYFNIFEKIHHLKKKNLKNIIDLMFITKKLRKTKIFCDVKKNLN